MLTSKEVLAIYEKAVLLIKIELPDRLYEGGISAFKVAVDTLRSNQEQLSTMLIAVSREKLLIKRLHKQIKFLLASGCQKEDVVWPEGLPNIMAIEDVEAEVVCLWDNLKLMHGELTRARTDLKAKINLLEIEARMGPSGVPGDIVPRRPTPPGVKSNNMLSDQDVIWDDLESGESEKP